jgi:hypothetical protein
MPLSTTRGPGFTPQRALGLPTGEKFLPSRSAAAALHAEVLALFGMELDSSRDAPPFTLQADEVEVQVSG